MGTEVGTRELLLRRAGTARRGLWASIVWLVVLALVAGCATSRRPPASPDPTLTANEIVPGRTELIGALAALPEDSFSISHDGAVIRLQFAIDAPSESGRSESPVATPAPFPHLTIGTVLGELGEPERAYGWFEVGGTFICQVVVFDYPRQGVRVTSYTCRISLMNISAVRSCTQPLCANPELPVLEVHYYEPTSFEEALHGAYHCSEVTIKCLLGRSAWQGLEKVANACGCECE